MQTEWGLVLSIIALVATAVGAVWAVAQNNGALRQRVHTLEKNDAEKTGALNEMRAQLARGDTRFAVLNENITGVKETLGEIKQDMDRLLARE